VDLKRNSFAAMIEKNDPEKHVPRGHGKHHGVYSNILKSGMVKENQTQISFKPLKRFSPRLYVSMAELPLSINHPEGSL